MHDDSQKQFHSQPIVLKTKTDETITSLKKAIALPRTQSEISSLLNYRCGACRMFDKLQNKHKE